MRIHSVAVRNYRIHQNIKIALDDERTLIGGPNESGKSTLVEAIHCCLFLKSKGTTETHRSMESTRWVGPAEVELSLSFGKQKYELFKRFSGNSGQTRLSKVGGETWQGEEAETRLASLLRVNAPTGGRGASKTLDQQWAHLWVWQGKSGMDPETYLGRERDGLLQRLHAGGGAGALQSELDTQVAAKILAACNQWFTQNGKPKAGSDLERKESAVRQAESTRKRAEDRMAKLNRAIQDFHQANQALRQATDDAATLAKQRSELKQKLAELDALLEKERQQQSSAQPAAQRYDELVERDAQVKATQMEFQTAQAALAPKTLIVADLQATYDARKLRSESAAQESETASLHARNGRRRHDLLRALADRSRKESVKTELLAKKEKVQTIQDERQSLAQQLAALPKIDAAKIQELNELDLAVGNANAAMEAMATRIDVIAGDSVQIGETQIQAGDSQVVTDDTDIKVGSHLHIRIRPGGGTNLAQARKAVRSSIESRKRVLEGLGVASTEKAGEVLAKRTHLLGEIEKIDATLKAMDADKLPKAIQTAKTELAEALAEVERRRENMPDLDIPEDIAVLVKQLSEDATLVREAEAHAERLQTLQKLAEQEEEQALRSLNEQREAIEAERERLTALQGRLAQLRDSFGDDADRAKALSEALTLKEETAQALAATKLAIKEKQPELLEKDGNRLDRAEKSNSESKEDAKTKLAVAQAELKLDGTEDPASELEIAQAQENLAKDQLAGVSRKAEATRLLRDLFHQEQRSLSDQYTKPLADKISDYLQCMFGPDASAKVVTNNPDGIDGISLVRSHGAVHFGALSGGASEQVAAAVRLSMAEVLAADHDGCLPVVFDDAFAYSDPDRVQLVQRMLDHAASKGLQLIVLTCTPSDYAGLGASSVAL